MDTLYKFLCLLCNNYFWCLFQWVLYLIVHSGPMRLYFKYHSISSAGSNLNSWEWWDCCWSTAIDSCVAVMKSNHQMGGLSNRDSKNLSLLVQYSTNYALIDQMQVEIENVRDSILHWWKYSARRISEQTGEPKSSVHRIIRNEMNL